ncbi:MAG: hypothetical protein IT221_03605 [Fluviicola sp.]|nr:hypothetical protein [Fluviicola sp.]
MKRISLLSLLIISSQTQAQTAIIAHKSHAGTESTFIIDPSTNFGIPNDIYIRTDSISDSIAVRISQDWSNRSIVNFDTVCIKKNENGIQYYVYKGYSKVYVSPENDTIQFTEKNQEELMNRVYEDRKKEMQKQRDEEMQKSKDEEKQKRKSSLPWIMAIAALGYLVTAKKLKP